MGSLVRMGAGRSEDTRNARFKKVTHETGIGVTKALFLRMPRQFWRVGVMSIVFFGGGAWVTWATTLPEDLSVKTYLVLAIGLLFCVTGLFLIAWSTLRITVTNDGVAQRFLRRKVVRWSQLEDVLPNGKSFATGVQLVFRDGTKMRIPALMIGYPAFLTQLRQHAPKAALLAQLGKPRAHARTPRS